MCVSKTWKIVGSLTSKASIVFGKGSGLEAVAKYYFALALLHGNCLSFPFCFPLSPESLALYQLLFTGPPTCGEHNRRIVCDAGSGFGVASKFTLGFMPLCSLINVFVSNLPRLFIQSLPHRWPPTNSCALQFKYLNTPRIFLLNPLSKSSITLLCDLTLNFLFKKVMFLIFLCSAGKSY